MFKLNLRKRTVLARLLELKRLFRARSRWIRGPMFGYRSDYPGLPVISNRPYVSVCKACAWGGVRLVTPGSAYLESAIMGRLNAAASIVSNGTCSSIVSLNEDIYLPGDRLTDVRKAIDIAIAAERANA